MDSMEGMVDTIDKLDAYLAVAHKHVIYPGLGM